MVDLLSRLPQRIDYIGVVGNDILIPTQWWNGPLENVDPVDFTDPTITYTSYLLNRDGTAATYQFTSVADQSGQLVLSIQEEDSLLLGPGTFYWSVDLMVDDYLITTIGGKLTMKTRNKAIEYVGDQT